MPEIGVRSVATDIPADEVHDKQLRKITKFVEARHDAGFTLSSLGVDVSVATPVSHGAGRLHQDLGFIGRGVAFSVRF